MEWNQCLVRVMIFIMLIAMSMLETCAIFSQPESNNANNANNRYIVLRLADLGLGNRLKTLSDFSKIAIMTDRTLLLSWLPHHACNITFQELFESGPTYLKLIDYDFLSTDEATAYKMAEEATVGQRYQHKQGPKH